MDELESYGGEVIFTPGDIVYSSSGMIEAAPPNLSSEKLMTLMESEGVTFDDLRAALNSFRGARVHVVGDTIVDSYVFCSLTGGIAKTPTFSLKHEKQVDFAGGAAVVAKHLRKAGADVRFSTVLGDDALKDFVLEDLRSQNIDVVPIIDHTRPTTQKSVFIASGYRMLKVDKLDNHPISDKILAQFKESIAAAQADAVVFSDFRHGIFNRETIPGLSASLPPNAFKVADSQVASRWGNILDFQGFDLITPNEKEARFALGDQDSTVRPMAMELYKRAECRTLILKLGDKGVITYRAPNPEVRSFFTVDSFVDKLVDAVGAGDALLSYVTLAMATTQSCVIASILGSVAAALACEHEGNNPVAPEDVLEKLKVVERQIQYA
jgi:rfaE bifunctional protein kinase chain/domain